MPQTLFIVIAVDFGEAPHVLLVTVNEQEANDLAELEEEREELYRDQATSKWGGVYVETYPFGQ